MVVVVVAVPSLACLISNIAWYTFGYTSMKPFDSDEEEAEQLAAYQKELIRKLTLNRANFANR